MLHQKMLALVATSWFLNRIKWIWKNRAIEWVLKWLSNYTLGSLLHHYITETCSPFAFTFAWPLNRNIQHIKYKTANRQRFKFAPMFLFLFLYLYQLMSQHDAYSISYRLSTVFVPFIACIIVFISTGEGCEVRSELLNWYIFCSLRAFL